MKQLLILSGKGGTGKTTIASSFIKLSSAKAFADCDVDAPNLHLVMEDFSTPKISDYYGLDKAYINQDKCVKCGLCMENCRFDAIGLRDNYEVDYFECEGCGVCEEICPVDAIELRPVIAGELKLYDDKKIFSTAQLKMGNGNSGLLVTEVKKQMKTAIGETEIAIIDGSPGIGCPVIASISGVDMVLIVVEPSISGINDMKRIINTAGNFGTKIAICVNKYDTNIEKSNEIKDFADKYDIKFIGNIPFDIEAVKAINSGKSIVDIDCKAREAIEDVYKKTINMLIK
ncbi:ATP-binding protein [Clostridium sp. D2Q-14]|uniref:ATP-binding protein n=1 Tax=Anaeromonas gelatinilytica TaxID=2683194 RepID=UPI00193BACB9|nr:ATP-binding protein [Anaeromonas gelatinilytica]